MSAEDQGKAVQPGRRPEKKPARPDEREPQPGKPGEGEPITTGDMQQVGALSPEEVPQRRHRAPDEPPVEESPGDQNSG